MREEFSTFTFTGRSLFWRHWPLDLKDLSGSAGRKLSRNRSPGGRIRGSRGHRSLAHPHQLRLSIEWLPWTTLLLLGVGDASGEDQMTTSPYITNCWAPVEGSNYWFALGNWRAGKFPTPSDDVVIFAGGPALIGGDQDPASA